jgi:hypothetical protein
MARQKGNAKIKNGDARHEMQVLTKLCTSSETLFFGGEPNARKAMVRSDGDVM